MTNAIATQDTRTAGQKAADTRRARMAQGATVEAHEASATMVAAGLKAAETRRKAAHFEVIMELGAAICQGCGAETSIPRTQTQGMAIMRCAKCRNDAAPTRGRRFHRGR